MRYAGLEIKASLTHLAVPAQGVAFTEWHSAPRYFGASGVGAAGRNWGG